MGRPEGRQFSKRPPPQTGEAKQKADLAALAASDFDPNDYLSRGGPAVPCANWCRICGVRYAPGAVCGYCRGRVRVIRLASGRADTDLVVKRLQTRSPMLHCWEPGPDTKDGEEQTCFMITGHDGPCSFIPNSEIKAILDKRREAAP